MTPEDFKRQLRADGFDSVVEVAREAQAELPRHRHAFEARALVLHGRIDLECDGVWSSYEPGQVFQLAREQEHAERYGPLGVRYLVGRR